MTREESLTQRRTDTESKRDRDRQKERERERKESTPHVRWCSGDMPFVLRWLVQRQFDQKDISERGHITHFPLKVEARTAARSLLTSSSRSSSISLGVSGLTRSHSTPSARVSLHSSSRRGYNREGTSHARREEQENASEAPPRHDRKQQLWTHYTIGVGICNHT